MATAGASSVPGVVAAAAPPSIRGRSRKRRSLVWSYFVYLPSSLPGSEGDRAMCKRCEQKLCTGGKHGTSHLKRHILMCFPFPAERQPQPSLLPTQLLLPPPPQQQQLQGVQVRSPSSVHAADVLDQMNQLADDFDNTMPFPAIDHNDPNTSFEESEGLVNSYLAEDGNVVFQSDAGVE